jgi:hypothetical protein
VVERYLAKVAVDGSNPFTRSSFPSGALLFIHMCRDAGRMSLRQTILVAHVTGSIIVALQGIFEPHGIDIESLDVAGASLNILTASAIVSVLDDRKISPNAAIESIHSLRGFQNIPPGNRPRQTRDSAGIR